MFSCTFHLMPCLGSKEGGGCRLSKLTALMLGSRSRLAEAHVRQPLLLFFVCHGPKHSADVQKQLVGEHGATQRLSA